MKVDRHTKTKKTIYTSFELFCIRERDIPMEVLELPNKTEKVLTFAWEPQGHRFVIVHGDGPRYNVSFYSMKDEKGKLSVKPVGEHRCDKNKSFRPCAAFVSVVAYCC